jgi:hypothetical protein
LLARIGNLALSTSSVRAHELLAYFAAQRNALICDRISQTQRFKKLWESGDEEETT